jgi:hypothetical protein
MAVKAIVKVSELEGARRLDAEYYQPKYLKALNALEHLNAVLLADMVKAKEIAPEFLFTFLKSKPIIELLDRKTTATMYPAVSWQDVLSLPIFKPDQNLEELTIERVRETQQSLQQSKSLYLQAEQILLDELRWDKLDLSQPKSYAVSLSQARDVSRVDAEHFQPKYDSLLQHLSRMGETKRLGDILWEPIQKGVTPHYLPEGEIVVVNSQHLGRYCLNLEETDRTTEEFWRQNRRAHIQNLDLMMYATGAPYVGRSNIYFEGGRKAIAGVDILLVRPNPRICHPVYLAVFCNSAIGMEQAAKYQKGSNQQHLYPDDVNHFLVYLPSKEFQEHVADLVLQSYQARKKAKALLEEARKKVEELIEKKGR